MRDYTKILKGRTVLDHVNLELETGKCYGFYGPNGCGKSMLFRAVAGLIHPTEGSVSVFGQVLGKDCSLTRDLVYHRKRRVLAVLYRFENLKMLASIRNEITENDIRETLTRVGLDPDDTRTYKKYSLGMKQRLAIAQAVMERPKLIILDEPTNALDKKGVQLVWNLIREERERGATILIVSHNQEDLQQMCSDFFEMYEGRLEKGEMPQ